MKNTITRRSALGLALAGFAAPSLITSSQAATSGVLVELFTSQGCSDCPPADKVAGELAQQAGVHVVSLNVDYWDYLGWKDTLGKAQYSQRQTAYAKARGDGEVYTPQMVINGAVHAVGSRKNLVEAAIAEARAKANYVDLSIVGNADALHIKVGAGTGNGTVWLMGISPSVSVPIGRGENAGTNVTYHNVVRHLVSAGTWNGNAAEFNVSRNSVVSGDCRKILAVLQQGNVGSVLGLSTITIS